MTVVGIHRPICKGHLPSGDAYEGVDVNVTAHRVLAVIFIVLAALKRGSVSVAPNGTFEFIRGILSLHPKIDSQLARHATLIQTL